MAEEAQSNPPSITAEITVGDAVWALTEQNAIFRNGRQVVIPHLGVDFMAELLAALSTYEFQEGFVTNRLAADEVTDPMEELAKGDCGDLHPAGVARCERRAGHTGSHHGWMAPGDVMDGQDDIYWRNEQETQSAPSRDGLDWEGFHVRPFGKEDSATVTHNHSPKGVTLVGLDHAEGMLISAIVDEYDRLCAKAYLAWHEQTFPVEPTIQSVTSWREWIVGDVLYNDEGQRAIVYAHDGRSPALVTQEGQIIDLSDDDLSLGRWKVGIPYTHNFNQEG